MHQLILIISYIVCAFIPLLLMGRTRTGIATRAFWVVWLISLTGAFFGGLFGTMLIARTGFELGFFARSIPAVLGAWLFAGIFIKLRDMPGNW